MTLDDAVVLAGASVDAVADFEDGDEQRAGGGVANLKLKLNWFCVARSPGQESVRWRKRYSHKKKTISNDQFTIVCNSFHFKALVSDTLNKG